MAGYRLIDLQFKQDVGVRAKFGGEHHRRRLADEPVVANWPGSEPRIVKVKCLTQGGNWPATLTLISLGSAKELVVAFLGLGDPC